MVPSRSGAARRRAAARTTDPTSPSSNRPSCCASARWSSSCWRRCARLHLDEASRGRLREIYEQSIRELAEGLSPGPGRRARPDVASPSTSETPSDAELRIAHAQLVGWLGGPLPRDPGHAGGPAGGGPGPARRDAPAVAAPGSHPTRAARAPISEPDPADLRRPTTSSGLTGARYRRNHNAVTRPHPVESPGHETPDNAEEGTGPLATTVVHPSAHPHRVLDARRCRPGQGPGAGGGGRRAAGPRDHRSRQHVRRPRLLRRLPRRGHQPGHRHRGLHGRPSRGTSARCARARSTTPAATSAGGEKLYYHLTLLAETTEGYRNLLKLSSAAYLEGYYYKPRVDWELLERHARGHHRHHRMPGRGRAPGAVGRRPGSRPRRWPAASRTSSGATTSSWSSRTTACPSSTRPTRPWCEIARRLGAPLLATNDSHYTHREDPWPTTPCCACRPGPSSTTPSGSSSRVRSTI